MVVLLTAETRKQKQHWKRGVPPYHIGKTRLLLNKWAHFLQVSAGGMQASATMKNCVIITYHICFLTTLPALCNSHSFANIANFRLFAHMKRDTSSSAEDIASFSARSVTECSVYCLRQPVCVAFSACPEVNDFRGNPVTCEVFGTAADQSRLIPWSLCRYYERVRHGQIYYSESCLHFRHIFISVLNSALFCVLISFI